ncbi:MAG: hypothetical protein CNE98_01950 [Bacteroidetes bacterium MED-G17]|nr:MAG: hypothetical protein CNE98_01950 [Bacteroidetes bacterium MED-G17]CAI8342731.1 MAG: Uncharacterised protein [Bacteroidetes bacterium MED-G17]
MKRLCVLLSLLNGANMLAQTLSVATYPSYVMAHHGYMSNIESHGIGFELNYFKQKSALLEKYYPQLDVGHKINYINMGKPDLTGSAFAYIPNLNYRSKSNKLGQVVFQIGLGIAYVSQKFDPFENKDNLAISSHMNVAFQTNIGWQSPLGLKVFGGLSHYSNGAFHAPNLGINILNLGIAQNILKRKVEIKPENDTFSQNKSWYIFGFMASKEASIERQERFYIYGMGLEKKWARKKPKRYWRTGLDINMDGQHGSYNNQNQTSYLPTKIDESIESGLRLGHLWQMGRLEGFADLGFYITSPSSLKKSYYQKIGLNYHLSGAIFIRTDLVSHVFAADYFSLGVGYAL